jgi:hypothetical protein
LYFFSSDTAGGIEARKSQAVNIDKTPPEASVQFDPATKDIVVFGRDAGSGVPNGPLAPTAVTPTRHGELRTYTVTDAADNTLVFETRLRRMGHELRTRLVSLRYCASSCGPVRTPPVNTQTFAWATHPDGSLQGLQQKLSVGSGPNRQHVEAEFDAQRNQTTIHVHGTRLVQSGLVLLRLATDDGKLIIEH